MTDMLTIILPASWALFALYLLWFVTSAKCSVAITFDDAKALLAYSQEKLQVFKSQVASAVA